MNYSVLFLGLVLFSTSAFSVVESAREFHAALFSGDTQKVQRMLEQGEGSVDGLPEQNVPPAILVSAAYGHFELTRFLLSQKANPNHAHYPSDLLPKR